MNIGQNAIKLEENEDSWLILKLQEQSFAINCQDVIAIFRAEEDATKMSGYSDLVRGVIDFRGSVVPLLEGRRVLGMIPFSEEHQDFSDMMEVRSQEHMNWVNELKRSTQEGEAFKLATSPHECAFGKWYDHYHTDNQSVAFDLKKIDEPHKKLHETAGHLLECKKIKDEDERKTKQEELLKTAENKYMPKVLELLEAMKEIYKTGYREMCVVIANEKNKMLGLLVDEVTSVEPLDTVDSQGLFNTAFSTSCVDHVAKSKHMQGEVFVLDREALFNKLF